MKVLLNLQLYRTVLDLKPSSVIQQKCSSEFGYSVASLSHLKPRIMNFSENYTLRIHRFFFSFVYENLLSIRIYIYGSFRPKFKFKIFLPCKTWFFLCILRQNIG